MLLITVKQYCRLVNFSILQKSESCKTFNKFQFSDGSKFTFPPIYIAAGSMMVSGTNLDARIVTEWDQRVGGCGLREKVSSALLDCLHKPWKSSYAVSKYSSLSITTR